MLAYMTQVEDASILLPKIETLTLEAENFNYQDLLKFTGCSKPGLRRFFGDYLVKLGV